ncbi:MULTISPECIES: hypothetical protein [unclassified Colwellia]|uniref:hypothetical protein n=1 Tax=unclassified Colwellia TaxID=196834 RepID=UPI0015F7670F|nr:MULTISPECIES: hypothetical protein [unclassified Colwellia]MBA6233859.1 hypothetical protein [Colwellia sp. MB02u-7]MBA6237325.1 hypothetical protein [Colwellia sp. MB02u-11]MBA6300325.1 hypothetical protein [Colwellia sp. MB3u-22]MBA6304665.1 hypothetical protein [Colwellia sp. MB02u-14]MBA6310916.1 hypothetical protein [Colwellia sp. MB3u-64]
MAEIHEEKQYVLIINAINKNIIVDVVIVLNSFAFVQVLVGKIFKPIDGFTKTVTALTENDGDLTV